MPKIEIDVDQILQCVVSLEIEPGDRLLVMGGVVIGCVERTARHVAPKPPNGTPTTPALPPKPKAVPQQMKDGVNEAIKRDITRRKILDLIGHSEFPLTAHDIRRRFHKEEIGPVNWLASQMAYLRNAKHILPTDPKARYPAYTVNLEMRQDQSPYFRRHDGLQHRDRQHVGEEA